MKRYEIGYALITWRNGHSEVYIPDDWIPLQNEKRTYTNGETWEDVIVCLIPSPSKIGYEGKQEKGGK